MDTTPLFRHSARTRRAKHAAKPTTPAQPPPPSYTRLQRSARAARASKSAAKAPVSSAAAAVPTSIEQPAASNTPGSENAGGDRQPALPAQSGGLMLDMADEFLAGVFRSLHREPADGARQVDIPMPLALSSVPIARREHEPYDRGSAAHLTASFTGPQREGVMPAHDDALAQPHRDDRRTVLASQVDPSLDAIANYFSAGFGASLGSNVALLAALGAEEPMAGGVPPAILAGTAADALPELDIGQASPTLDPLLDDPAGPQSFDCAGPQGGDHTALLDSDFDLMVEDLLANAFSPMGSPFLSTSNLAQEPMALDRAATDGSGVQCEPEPEVQCDADTDCPAAVSITGDTALQVARVAPTAASPTEELVHRDASGWPNLRNAVHAPHVDASPSPALAPPPLSETTSVSADRPSAQHQRRRPDFHDDNNLILNTFGPWSRLPFGRRVLDLIHTGGDAKAIRFVAQSFPQLGLEDAWLWVEYIKALHRRTGTLDVDLELMDMFRCPGRAHLLRSTEHADYEYEETITTYLDLFPAFKRVESTLNKVIVFVE